jgi:endonuclease/exonuclease/phosphatase (EEP) superfamily protein YafD
MNCDTPPPPDCPAMASESPTAQPVRLDLRKTVRAPRARKIAAVCVAMAMVHPVARLSDKWFWIADLLSHFQIAALAATSLALVVTFRMRWPLTAGLVLLAVVQTPPLFQFGGGNPVPADPGSNERMRILMANILFTNDDFTDLIRLIEREHPDVVGLVEYSQECRDATTVVREQFPYRIELPTKASGLALWFRKPPLRLDPPHWPVAGDKPVVHATFDFAGETRHLWLVHPRAPFTRARIGLSGGNPELAALAAEVAAVPGSRIIIGDLNSTEGSVHFHDLLRTTGLRDSRLGFGREPSWPSILPSFLRLALDHAFISDDLAVVDRRLGPYTGSDHFPLIVDLAPALDAKPSTQRAH